MNKPVERKIIIHGARQNNLKNIHLELPRNKLIVFTGVSGSGKSSLVFDTIYAEGQRRYVESLSSYARQFLERMNRPDVDYIQGISPAVAIEQKPPSRNPRSTVGTTTEIYDYLRLLYGRIGKTYCEVCGEVVKKDSTVSVIEKLKKFPEGKRLLITFPLVPHEKRSVKEELKYLLSKGFQRIYYEGEIFDMNENLKLKVEKEKILVIVERVSLDLHNVETAYSDSIETAFSEGEGRLAIVDYETKEVFRFSKFFECHGKVYQEPEPRMFSFNNPFGACPTCQGFGKTIGIDWDLVIPDKKKSIEDGAIDPFTKKHFSQFQRELIRAALNSGVRVSVPFEKLTDAEKKIIFEGARGFIGLNKFFEMLKEKSYKIYYRITLSRYRGYTTCPDCGGSRLRKDALNVRVGGKRISDLLTISLDSVLKFFEAIELSEYDWRVGGRIIDEIIKRLRFLVDVGIGYLTLDRLSSTLSGGETQRINLASILGSQMVGAIYILDEPSIGLHPRDNSKLIKVLHQLKNLGNTVLVVEHDPEMIKEADYIVDMGPGAGIHGGEVIFFGKFNELLRDNKSLTGKYLSGELKIPLPEKRRSRKIPSIKIYGARENNLKNIDVEIPLGIFVCITGVSGSGKSTLVNDILCPAIRKLKHNENVTVGKYSHIDGLGYITDAEIVDQSPIGRSSRSNPATYTKAFDFIRELYSQRPLAKSRGYTPGYFSFNIPGGRCETCQGEGFVKIEMQFLADIYLVCEDCKGTRFKKEVQEILYKGKSIVDVLNMTIEEALEFFQDQKKIIQRLQPLYDVGLGYLKLGQSSTTLSGGEAQRIKLAEKLIPRENYEHILYIFDEPTTGLHFHDIQKLLKCFDALIDRGNSVLVIEHNLDVIKYADYIIDLGPEAGDNGGEIVVTGTPEEIIKCEKSYTGQYLKRYLGL
ncbi:MAG: excinuclease ABC subunit UvrA [Ignavibacteria bacterium]|jgi:excinuclease ABC subunit A|nr:excinuclease ABC subunit UvrA [Ignavibacteria bacterium]MDH7527720.1 excinuclease ABC subunit UvrA [Ignavibacteria bacterium]